MGGTPVLNSDKDIRAILVDFLSNPAPITLARTANTLARSANGHAPLIVIDDVFDFLEILEAVVTRRPAHDD